MHNKKCRKCLALIPYKKRRNIYCSRSCAVSVNNVGVGRHGSVCKKVCNECGESLNKRSSKTKFCSRSCFSVYKIRSLYEKMDVSSNFSGRDVKTIKRFLVKKHGHSCEICSISKWRGQEAPLVLDHIDGNSTNEMKSNFRLVCAMCDSQLPTYKGRNKGNGRYNRRRRYQQGLSY